MMRGDTDQVFSFYVKYFLLIRKNFTLISIFVPGTGEIFHECSSSFNPGYVSHILIFNID